MRRGPAYLLIVTLLVPPPAAAQAINGSADWGYGHSVTRTGDEKTEDGSFTQAYTIGYQSVLWDPRFLTYGGELTFNRNTLQFGEREGVSRNTGFKASATLFPARPFPLSVQAMRSAGAEDANYPLSNPIRGGIAFTPGAVAALTTGQSSTSVNWQVNTPRVARLELSYDSGRADVGAGSIQADQQHTNVHALVAREGPRLRNTLRYDRSGFDTTLSQAFRQRYSDLSYELVATPSPRTSATVRAGRRSTFSLFDLPKQFGDEDAAFRPPSSGDVVMTYGVATLSHARSRLSADVTASYAKEQSAGGTESLLGTATTRYEVPGGITLSAKASHGERGQVVNGSHMSVLTSGVGAGAEYAVGFRWLQAGAGYDATRGRSVDLGREGNTRLWVARAHASTGVLRLVDLTVGYERGRSEDDLLDFGNAANDRARAAARTHGGRVVLEASWEEALTERGRDLTASTSRYSQGSGTASLTVSRDRLVTFSAGQFFNRSSGGNDSTKYAGVTVDAVLVGALRLAFNARREHVLSDLSRLDQAGYYTTGALEYRLRLFTFALEHRYTNLALSTAAQVDPLAFTGNQILLRVGRRFGFVR